MLADAPSGPLDGAVYLLDKEPGITSRKAASRAARAWGYRRFGHAGTLDPAASGLLVVLLGKATRLSRYITAYGKEYEFVLRLGSETDTGDETGAVVSRGDAAGVSRTDLSVVLERDFTGSFEQEVPAFSAVRIDGRRAYKRARKGIDQEMPVRPVTATDWRILETLEDAGFRLRVWVGSGTYVRALARDIGRALGVGGHAEAIRRTGVGHLRVESASRDPGERRSLLSMAQSVAAFETLSLDVDELRDVRHGRPVESKLTGTVALLDGDGELVGMGEGNGLVVSPVCVLRGL